MRTYRFDVERYEKLYRAGILTDDDQIELLDGDLIVRPPIGSRHVNVVNRLNDFLVRNARDRFFVSPQNPFRLDAHSMPQPDLALVHPRVLRGERYAAAYTDCREVPVGAVLAPLAFPDLVLPLAALFGQPPG